MNNGNSSKMKQRIDLIYRVMGETLVDVSHTKTAHILEGMKKLHYRSDKLTIDERLRFVEFWHLIAELYHSHRYDVSYEVEDDPLYEAQNEATFWSFHFGNTRYRTNTVWVFLLGQCIQMGQEVINTSMIFNGTTINTNHAKDQYLCKAISLMNLLNTQGLNKPGLWIWIQDDGIRSAMLRALSSNYHQLRVISMNRLLEKYSTKEYAKKGYIDMSKKDVYLSIIKVLEQHFLQGLSQSEIPPWLLFIHRRTIESLTTLQDELFKSIKPWASTSTFKKLMGVAYDKQLVTTLEYGLVEDFDSITPVSVLWDWEWPVANHFTDGLKLPDNYLQNHGLELLPKATKAEQHNHIINQTLSESFK